jgi:glycyl-tRNA synthetase (class II)
MYGPERVLRHLFLKECVDVVSMVGPEGLNIDEKVINTFAKKFPAAWRNWLEIHIRICTEPFVVDATGHMLIIARKK